MKNKYYNIIAVVLFTAFVFVQCEKDAEMNDAIATGGKGGSMARFAVAGNTLYTVDENDIHAFDISQHSNPVEEQVVRAGWGIETIFPYDDKLFLGTSSGMLVYDISLEDRIEYVSEVWHITTCDPVVVEGDYAYITLRTETWCGRNTNEMQIINISDIQNPVVVATYDMTKPYGLGIDGSNLFVCDDGLKVYDASDVFNVQLKHKFDINARDVIPYNGLLIVIGTDGLHQYSYDNGQITKLSTITSFN